MESSWAQEFKDFFICLFNYFRTKLRRLFYFFENIKSWLAGSLYRQRGKYTQPFLQSGLVLLVVVGIILGPTLLSETFPGLTNSDPWRETIASSVGISAFEDNTATLKSKKLPSEIQEYTVQAGETISSIADKFGVSVDTIRWENNLKDIKTIQEGKVLRILPVTGVNHKVKSGDTVYTIAKRYQVDPQVIVDWPYNSFANDETFALTVGQSLMIPDGIMPDEKVVEPRRYYAQIPSAGIVPGTGQFAWPANGVISQYFSWYHKAIDIANASGPDVLASDTGTVTLAGWVAPVAYGNHIMVDHGNGYVTLYAHLAKIYVTPGQRVSRGQAIGKMGSTGRSTGTHLHFEIRQGGALQNPLAFLK